MFQQNLNLVLLSQIDELGTKAVILVQVGKNCNDLVKFILCQQVYRLFLTAILWQFYSFDGKLSAITV